MKKIAVPITRNNHLIEDHFGQCTSYEIYTFSDANEVIDLQLLESNEGCGCKSNIVSELAKIGVTFMLSGYIGAKATTKLKDAGIGVVRGCFGESSDVILQFVEGEISDSGMGCINHNPSYRNGHGYSCNH